MKVQIINDDGRLAVDYADQHLCVRCVIPEAFPGSSFDEAGVCNYCRDEKERLSDSRKVLDDTLAAARRATEEVSGDYDCVLLYSGGKDSSLSLIELVREHGLRVLAVTLDNGFLARATADNMRHVLDAVGADHIVVRPQRDLMHGVYRSALTKTFGPETIKYSTAACGSCIGVVFAVGMRIAASFNVPLLAGGWTPGQMTDSAFVPAEFLRNVMATNLDPVDLTDERLTAGLDNWRTQKGTFPTGLINPLYAGHYSEESVLATLAEYGWSAPADTDSCSTNCRLNGLLIVDHLKKHGYHPYVYELAHHVRLGAMTREQALHKLRDLRLRAESVTTVAVELGIPSPLDR